MRKDGESYVLATQSKDRQGVSDESYLFHDDVRSHWIEVKSRDVSLRGEGVFKDQPILVYYHYRKEAEPNPIAMYHWVMDFVENFNSTIKPNWASSHEH